MTVSYPSPMKRKGIHFSLVFVSMNPKRVLFTARELELLSRNKLSTAGGVQHQTTISAPGYSLNNLDDEYLDSETGARGVSRERVDARGWQRISPKIPVQKWYIRRIRAQLYLQQ